VPKPDPENRIVIATAGAEVTLGAEWIKVMPYGVIKGRDGRGPYILRDQAHGAQVVAATAAYQQGADLPVDYDHQTQRSAANGQPAPASGWIKDLEARADGIYGRVEWTNTAAAHLSSREYRYFSPAWIGAGKDSTGPVLRLVGGGLTNTPNFDLPALASQGDPMDPELLKALGLAADTPPATVAAHAQALADGAKAVTKILGLPDTTPPAAIASAAQATVAALAGAMKLDPAAATLPTIATAAQALATQAAAGTTVDLTQYVPMGVHTAVASQLAALQGQTQQTEATRAVDEAVKAGKVTPAMQAWATAYASQDLTAFKSYVSAAPVLVATAGQLPATPPAAATGEQLSAEEVAVASQLGLTADQYAAAKTAKEGK